MGRYQVREWRGEYKMSIAVKRVANSKRLRELEAELEAELSDEKIAEIFRTDDYKFKKEYASPMLGRVTRRGFIRRAFVPIIVIVFVIVIFQLFAPKIVPGGAMGPTLMPRDCVVVAKKAYSAGAFAYGDVVMHNSRVVGPDGRTQELFNRIVGLPGDVVEIKEGSLWRNGERLVEPYVPGGTTPGDMALSMVPEGCCFVLGDNRGESIDSRDGRVGYVPLDQVRGKAVRIIMPLSRVGGVA